MSDRSEEVTTSAEPPSTEELLEETSRLLDGSSDEYSNSVVDDSTERSAEGTGVTSPASDDSQPIDHSELDDETASAGFRWPSLPSVRPSRVFDSLSLSTYFSPKVFLISIGVLAAGVFAADMVAPIGGRIAGLLLVSFAIGLVGSKRRYLEIATAGATVGGVATLLDYALLAVLGIGQALVGIGAVLGLILAVIGYYFGRDLNDGLSRDIE